MNRGFVLFLFGCFLFLSACTDHIVKGDEYYAAATDAVNNDSILKAYTLIEKAIDEYSKGKDKEKEYKARIFLSLIYFSTDQKQQAYEIVKSLDNVFPDTEDFPLYLNYYRIKAYYKSLYENNTDEAVALMDTVLCYDIKRPNVNQVVLNLDRLNKCEMMLNGGRTEGVDEIIASVISNSQTPTELDPQIFANLARLKDLSGDFDSAFQCAKLVIERTSKIHEDIDNNIYALDIILRYTRENNLMDEYIKYRDFSDSIKQERHGAYIKYEMAFAHERLLQDAFRIKAKTEKKMLIWIMISIGCAALAIVIFLILRHKQIIIRNQLIQLECDRLDAEAFRRKLENELLYRKINSKSEELKKANDEILELSQQLANNQHNLSGADSGYLQRLLETAAKDFPEFQQRLMSMFPNITKTESTLACLIKLNLSSEEITTAMSISKSGLIKARYRLRKRLDIDSSQELDKFIASL